MYVFSNYASKGISSFPPGIDCSHIESLDLENNFLTNLDFLDTNSF